MLAGSCHVGRLVSCWQARVMFSRCLHVKLRLLVSVTGSCVIATCYECIMFCIDT